MPAIAAMHGPHSLVRCGNEARPFRSVPVNVLPRWWPNQQISYDSSANLYDSVVSTGRNPESYEVCRLMVPTETSYESDVLTKDTAVILGLPNDGNQ